MFLWNNAVAGKRRGEYICKIGEFSSSGGTSIHFFFSPKICGHRVNNYYRNNGRNRFQAPISLIFPWSCLGSPGTVIPWIFDSLGCQLSNGSRLIRSAKIFTCFIRPNVCEAIVSTFCFVLLSYIYRLKHKNLIMLHGTFLAVQWLVLCFQGQEHGFES